jgi:plastocyanin
MRTAFTVRRRGVHAWLLLLCLGILVPSCHAQSQDVSTQVALVNTHTDGQASTEIDHSNVVVWLTRADRAAITPASSSSSGPTPRLVQRNKSFEPHLLVVEVGTVVLFPNKDPFFHNIFSLYNGKPFDLGLYEAGSTRSVRFDRPGASFLFCNIHAEMSAVVVALDTPYFGVSDHSGQVKIRAVPPGRYLLHIWYEKSEPEALQALTRSVTISVATRTLPSVQVLLDPNFTLSHKNKYGQDYVPPPSPAYAQP